MLASSSSVVNCVRRGTLFPLERADDGDLVDLLLEPVAVAAPDFGFGADLDLGVLLFDFKLAVLGADFDALDLELADFGTADGLTELPLWKLRFDMPRGARAVVVGVDVDALFP